MSSMTPDHLAHLPSEYLAEDRGPLRAHLGIAMITLQTIFFSLFIISRFTANISHGVESWFLIPGTYVCCISQSVNTIHKSLIVPRAFFCNQLTDLSSDNSLVSVKIAGTGRHMEHLPLTDPDRMTPLQKIATASVILNVPSVTFPKLATISMYLRIFTAKRIRHATWLVGLLIVPHSLAGLIGSFLTCQPFEFDGE